MNHALRHPPPRYDESELTVDARGVVVIPQYELYDDYDDHTCHCEFCDPEHNELFVCRHCGLQPEEHTEEGKCLFDVTHYQSRYADDVLPNPVLKRIP